jgi:hypothetical protein
MKEQATLQKRKAQLLELTASFCDQKLDDEHKELSHKAIVKLFRKSTKPFETDTVDEWAAGIIHAIGSVNLLFDDAFDPHITEEQLNTFFGTNPEKTLEHADFIKDTLNLHIFDKEFSTNTMDEKNPLNDMVSVDGIFIPLKLLPERLKNRLKEAHSAGYRIEFRSDEV